MGGARASLGEAPLPWRPLHTPGCAAGLQREDPADCGRTDRRQEEGSESKGTWAHSVGRQQGLGTERGSSTGASLMSWSTLARKHPNSERLCLRGAEHQGCGPFPPQGLGLGAGMCSSGPAVAPCPVPGVSAQWGPW